MSDLHRIIREDIAARDVISFARFMELALYCPNFGYYERTDVAPGRMGDFFTSVSVGSLFGELLACKFAGWLESLPAGPLQIVEAGAHDGRLALDILGWLRLQQPKLAQRLEYWIIEPSRRRESTQKETLGGLANSVRWFDSWHTVPRAGVRGIIFSNELFDAMPAHRLGWDAGRKRWFEWGVTIKDNKYTWIKTPLEFGEWSAELLDVPEEVLNDLPDNFTTEVCPAALDWWRQAAHALKVGKLVAIDYGLAAPELFFVPMRKSGTLRAYYRHHATHDLLARAGEQDLTCQVNFPALQLAGLAAGLITETLVSQERFLTGIVEQFVRDGGRLGGWASPRSRQFQTLTHPEHLGQSFHVLIQAPRPTATS